MIVFLDFDGCTHRFGSVYEDCFCYLPRLEKVLRSFSDVKIVISSDWRKAHSLDTIRAPFSPDIRSRVIGVTPCFSLRMYTVGIRLAEAEAYLRENGLDAERWVALDDFPDNFMRATGEIHPRLVVCDDGFREREETLLTQALLLMAEGKS